jgi:antitoxin PrlF
MTAARTTTARDAPHESTLSAKGQTTIPGAVRKRLGLEPGDTLRYEVTADGSVQLRKARKIDLAWARAIETTLTEWHREADDDL